MPEYRRVDVTVHNIGAEAARGFDVVLLAGDEEVGRQSVPNVSPPGSLEPSTVRLGFPFTPAKGESEFTAVIDVANHVDEITEINNRTTTAIETPLVRKRRHAHP